MRTVLAIVCFVGIGASSAEAQDQHRHDGFWWGFGLGGGWNSWQWSFGPDGGRGGAAYFRLGGTINEHVLFGGEALVFFRETDRGAEEITRVNATATALLYPGGKGGWFLKGGFGVADADGLPGEREGIGLTLGTGFDLRIGRNIYVTPNLDTMLQFFETNTNASLVFTLGLGGH